MNHISEIYDEDIAETSDNIIIALVKCAVDNIEYWLNSRRGRAFYFLIYL